MLTTATTWSPDLAALPRGTSGLSGLTVAGALPPVLMALAATALLLVGAHQVLQTIMSSTIEVTAPSSGRERTRKRTSRWTASRPGPRSRPLRGRPEQVSAEPPNEVDRLVSQCADRPGALESLCADLFRARGYHVAVTPSSQDSRIRLRLLRNRSISVMSCVCCQRDQAVGSDVVLRLCEAGRAERTDNVVVVTTGVFSMDAAVLARRRGVRLIDGEHLVRMCQQVWGDLPETTIPLATIDLTRERTLTGLRPVLQPA